MKIVGVIPARYASTRFPGKPLADICGKPMIWWVYQQIKKVKELDEVYVATDDSRIEDICKKFNMNVVMTSNEHKTHLDRLGEFSKIIKSDFYININGDEPLILPEYIECLLPTNVSPEEFYVANAMMEIDKPVEIADPSKIKLALDVNDYCLYLSRNPIPFPKGNSNFVYKKFVGIQCFTKSSLNFCSNTPRGFIENTEDIDEFRFIENGKKLKFINTTADTLAVDTPKDLEYVRKVIAEKIKAGELSNE